MFRARIEEAKRLKDGSERRISSMDAEMQKAISERQRAEAAKRKSDEMLTKELVRARARVLVVVLLSSASLLHVPAFLNARLRKRKLLLLLAIGSAGGRGCWLEQGAVSSRNSNKTHNTTQKMPPYCAFCHFV